MRFDTLDFEPFRLEAFGLGLRRSFLRQAFGFETFGFDALRFDTFGFSPFGVVQIGTGLPGLQVHQRVGSSLIEDVGCIFRVLAQVEIEMFDRRFRQSVAQRLDLGGQRRVDRNARLGPVQLAQGLARRRADAREHGCDRRFGRAIRCSQATGVRLGRAEQQADRRHLGHRESAVHGMQRPQQAFAVGRETVGGRRQPGFDGVQMALDLGVEDFQQQGVDRCGHGLDIGLIRDFVHGTGIGRHVDGRRFAIGLRERRGRLRGGLFSGFVRRDHQRCGARGQRVVAGGNARGVGLHGVQVRAQCRFTAQHGLQFGQRIERLVDHFDHGRTGRTAVEDAVEHLLDRPAEFAERLGADQAAAAFERVEYAADGAQQFEVVRLRAPRRQQGVEVFDFAGEFLEKHLADLVVDLVTDVLEATRDIAYGGRRSGRCRHGRGCGGRRFDRRDGRRIGRRGPGLDAARQLADVDRRRGVGRTLRCGVRGFGGIATRDRVGCGQRPVAQRLEAAAGDVENVGAIGALFAQGFEVVLEAGERVGEGVELTSVGHALAGDELALHVQTHAVEVARGLGQLQHDQRATDLRQQARDFLQFGVVPAGFDERHQRLARIGEIGDGLAHEHGHRLLRLDGQRVFASLRAVGAESGHLVVEGRIDVQQCAGDIEQRVLTGGGRAADDAAHHIALLLHDRAGRPQPEHAQGIGNAGQHIDLGTQAGDVGRGGAQVQIQRILDPQQVLLDCRRDGAQQGTVAAAEAATRVFEFGLAGQLRAEVEGLAHRVERGMRGLAVGDVIEQLARGFLGAIGQHRVERRGLQALTDFAFDAGEDLPQRSVRARGKRTIRERFGDASADPQHATLRFGAGVQRQRRQAGDEGAGVPGTAGARPGLQGDADLAQCGVGIERSGLLRAGIGVGHAARQVRSEQDAFAQARFAARGAQFVEQRQQHDRDVTMTALQPLEVVGQQQHAAQQCGRGEITIGDGAVAQRMGQLLHLFDDHRRRLQFDHLQRALGLVQIAGAQPHAARVVRGFDKAFQFDPRLAQHLVQLGFDPAEHGVVDGIAQHAHAATPTGWPHACAPMEQTVIGSVPWFRPAT